MRAGVIGLAALLAACGGAQAERVEMTGQRDTRTVAAGAFDKIELKGPDRVVVRVGGAPGVEVTGDRAVLDQLVVRVEDGGKLVIERKGRNWNVRGENERATVTVSVPRLAAAAVGGSGEMTVDRVGGGGEFAAAVGGSGDLRVAQVQAGKLDAAVGGSGDLSLDAVDAQEVNMAIGGSGTINATGRARKVEAAVGGSGDIRAAALQAEDAAVSIAGSGSASIHARGRAEIAMMGSGDVVVTGGAQCETSKMGSGSVRCGG